MNVNPNLNRTSAPGPSPRDAKKCSQAAATAPMMRSQPCHLIAEAHGAANCASMRDLLVSRSLAALGVAARAVERTFDGLSPRLQRAARYVDTLIEQNRTEELADFARHVGAKLIGRSVTVRPQPLVDASADRVAAWLDSAYSDVERTDAIKQLHQIVAPLAPRISVIIPCYNYGGYLNDAVVSVERQTIAPAELIVVDDGSTDPGTIALTDALAEEGRITLVRQPNQGLAAARNAGAARASGEFLLFLDADDRLDPNALAVLSYALRVQPEAAYAYSYQRFFGDMNYVMASQSFNTYDLLWSNHPSVTVLLRRTAFAQSPGYQSRMIYGYEDWEFWIALSERKLYGTCVPIPVFEHRKHGPTMTERAYERRDHLMDRILELHPMLYQPETIQALKRRDRPGVTVIVSTDAPLGELRTTIEDLVQQTLDDFEVVIVAGPVGRAGEKPSASDWLQSNPIPKLQLSTADTINQAALCARGDYVVLLTAGHRLDALALERLLLAACGQRDAAFVVSGLSAEAERLRHMDPRGLAGRDQLIALVARNVFLALGGLDDDTQKEARDRFWSRLHAARYRGYAIPSWIGDERGRSSITRARGAAMRRLRSRLSTPRARPTIDTAPIGDRLIADLAIAWRNSTHPPLQYHRYRRGVTPNPFPLRWWRDLPQPSVLYAAPDDAPVPTEDFELLSCLEDSGARLTMIVATHSLTNDQPLHKLTDDVFNLAHLGADVDARVRIALQIAVSRNIDVICIRGNTAVERAMRRLTSATRQIVGIDLRAQNENAAALLYMAASIGRNEKLRDLQKMIMLESIL